MKGDLDTHAETFEKRKTLIESKDDLRKKFDVEKDDLEVSCSEASSSDDSESDESSSSSDLP